MYAIPDPSSLTMSHVNLSSEEIENLKSEFRRVNRTDEILARGSRDRSYESYCEQFISQMTESEKNEPRLIKKLNDWRKRNGQKL